MSCVIPLGEDSWKFAPGCFQTLLHVPSPFVDLDLHPFVVKDPRCEYKYMLGLVFLLANY